MTKTATPALRTPHDRTLEALRQIALIVGGSLFVALCAQKGSISLMPLTPVPLTLQNFAVLLVGLLLGSRRGFAAMMLYLVAGLTGFPVFSPGGPGGIAQLFGGVTGGFLLAYPFMAFVAGYVFERASKTLLRAVMAGVFAEALLFASGLAWLYTFTHSLSKAAYFGLYWFIAAEVIKIMIAAGIASRWHRKFV